MGEGVLILTGMEMGFDLRDMIREETDPKNGYITYITSDGLSYDSRRAALVHQTWIVYTGSAKLCQGSLDEFPIPELDPDEHLLCEVDGIPLDPRGGVEDND